jgi:hypothetical protein
MLRTPFVLSVLSLAGCQALGIPNGGVDPDAAAAEALAKAPVPFLEVTAPERGLMTTENSGTLLGSTAPAGEENLIGVMVNGSPVEVAANGQFTQELQWAPGTHFIQTVAQYDSGGMGVDQRAVISGAFLPQEEALEQGLVFKVSEQAMTEMGKDAQNYFTGSDLEDFIQNPVMSLERTVCVGFCYTFYGIEMNAYNPTFSDLDARVFAKKGGVDMEITMFDFAMDWTGIGVVSELGYTGTGRVTAEEMALYMNTDVVWVDGELQVVVTGISVDARGMTFDFDNFMYEAMTFFGFGLEWFVEGMIEDTFAKMMYYRTPERAQEILEDMNFSKVIPVMGQDYILHGEVADLKVKKSGVTLDFSTGFEPPESLHELAPGSLKLETKVPSVAASDKVTGLMGLNLLNQVFFGLWDGGALDMVAPGEMFGLLPEHLGLLGMQVERVMIKTEAMLPPTLAPAVDGNGVARLSLGDLIFAVHDGNGAEALMKIVLGLEGDLFLEQGPEGGLVPVLKNVVVHPAMAGNMPGLTMGMLAGLDALIQPLAKDILPQQLASLMEFPLDFIEGYHFEDVEVSAAKGDGGYFQVLGTMVAE